ncbi:MAG: thiamine-phosphate kinase [Leadbetterella sp.]
METIESVGEFGIIERIKNKFAPNHLETISAIQDDCAVIDIGDSYQLISSNSFLEGVHFDLHYFPLKHLGHKLVSIAISNIAAMNGIPKQILVNIAISNRFGLADIDEIYEGIKIACDDYKVDLVGGDTSSSRAGLILSITSIGSVNKNEIVYRKGASENDIICVTGDLGAAYLGLQVLEREKQEFLGNPNMQPKLDEKSHVVGKQLKPTARMDIIYELKEKGILPTSMIDVSDGLSSEILQLSKSNGLGFNVFFENVPIENVTLETSAEFNLNPITCIMHGGDDYELLFTIKQSDFEKIKNISDVSQIGYVTKNVDNWLVLNSGEKTKIIAQGWK